LTEGFPQQLNPFFLATPPFPVENRVFSPLSMSAVRKTLQENPSAFHALSDFHLLIYLKSLGLFEEVRRIHDTILFHGVPDHRFLVQFPRITRNCAVETGERRLLAGNESFLADTVDCGP
jgi:hypothetical protein